jgi:hypothetical protein
MGEHGPAKLSWDAWRDAYARLEQARLMVEECRSSTLEDQIERDRLKDAKLAMQAMIGACDVLKAATAQLSTFVAFSANRAGS